MGAVCCGPAREEVPRHARGPEALESWCRRHCIPHHSPGAEFRAVDTKNPRLEGCRVKVLYARAFRVTDHIDRNFLYPDPVLSPRLLVNVEDDRLKLERDPSGNVSRFNGDAGDGGCTVRISKIAEYTVQVVEDALKLEEKESRVGKRYHVRPDMLRVLDSMASKSEKEKMKHEGCSSSASENICLKKESSLDGSSDSGEEEERFLTGGAVKELPRPLTESPVKTRLRRKYKRAAKEPDDTVPSMSGPNYTWGKAERARARKIAREERAQRKNLRSDDAAA